jgi:hypothetical protein
MTCQKNPYPTRRLALRALEAVRANGKPGKKPVRAYPCQECHQWHLTSKKLTGYVRARPGQEGDAHPRSDRWLVRVPLGLFGGWITVAMVAGGGEALIASGIRAP